MNDFGKSPAHISTFSTHTNSHPNTNTRLTHNYAELHHYRWDGKFSESNRCPATNTAGNKSPSICKRGIIQIKRSRVLRGGGGGRKMAVVFRGLQIYCHPPAARRVDMFRAKIVVWFICSAAIDFIVLLRLFVDADGQGMFFHFGERVFFVSARLNSLMRLWKLWAYVRVICGLIFYCVWNFGVVCKFCKEYCGSVCWSFGGSVKICFGKFWWSGISRFSIF